MEHSPDRNVFGRTFQVQQQNRLQCGNGELIDTKRAEQGVLSDLLDEDLLARDDAGLRSAQQLVAAEANDVNSGPNAFGGGRFSRGDQRFVFKQTSAAD